jgi:RND family efflux transporter MFP subunit
MNQTLKTLLITSLILGLPLTTHSAESNEHAHETNKQVEHGAKDQKDEHGEHEKEHGGHEDESDGHKDEHGGHEEEGGGVELSSDQINLANIKIKMLEPRLMDYDLYAPGEIKANGYTSYHVSPQVDSVVLRRHAALGDHVEKGQALVSLFSETVAEAQALYRVTSSEWKRVKGLGRKAVGDKRYVSAQTEYEASYARLKVYGLSEKALQSLTEQASSQQAQALGEYTLNAAIEGAVLLDDFHQGQRVEAGGTLMKLANEHVLWVEARLTPSAELNLPSGTEAKVKVGNEWFKAKVAQEAHTIDPQTRTRVVRLLVNNDEHRLHPGMFADVYFEFKTSSPVIAVPETALMRGADGDWMVYIEEKKGQFEAAEVELGRSLGKWREIHGIKSGTKVVIEGAFFVASQIAKGGFDPHNH